MDCGPDMDLRKIKWKKDFNSIFWFSEYGHVFSEGRNILRKLNQNKSGYYQVLYKRKAIYVHKLVCMLFNGTKSGCVLHRDGNKLNNYYLNLYWGTAKQNALDRKNHGTHYTLKGEMHPLAKLKYEQALKIKTDLRPQRTIAKEYGIAQSLVYRIKKGLSWPEI